MPVYDRTTYTCDGQNRHRVYFLNFQLLIQISFRSLSRKIPAKEKEIIIDKLLKAIKNLRNRNMKVILQLYLEDPRTYVERSVEALGIEANNVSVLKNRAIKMLPELMDMTAEDYYDSFVLAHSVPKAFCTIQPVTEKAIRIHSVRKKSSVSKSQEKLMATMLCNIIEVIREIEKDSEV